MTKFIIKLVWVSLMTSVLCACSVKVKEAHYFKSGGDNPNYYRLKVTVGAKFSKARYMAGYYDERAIDLFLNEFKVDSYNPKSTTSGSDNENKGNGEEKSEPSGRDMLRSQKSPGTEDDIKPLDPTQRGRFLIILSTNADAIADTIGSFAESEGMANAVVALAAAPRLRELDESKAEAETEQVRLAAYKTEITALIGEAPDEISAKKLEDNFLHTLSVISRGLNQPMSFKDFDEAEKWIEAIEGARK